MTIRGRRNPHGRLAATVTSVLPRTGGIRSFVRAAQCLGFVTALALCAVVLWSAVQGPAPLVLALALVGLSALWPAHALLLVVALVPVAGTIAAAFTGYEGPTGWLLTAALGAGWLIGRARPRRPAGAQREWTGVLVFGAIIVASLAVELAGIRALVSPEAFPGTIADALVTLLHTRRVDYVSAQAPIAASVTLLLGLLTYWIAARQDGELPLRVLHVFAIGAAGAGLLNILRLVEGALRAEHFWRALVGIPQVVRFSGTFADVNAAGSFFALALLTAAGSALHARGLERLLFGAAGAICGIALWLSGSRSAILGVLLAGALWLAVSGGAPARRALLAMAGAAALVVWLFPNPIADRGAVGALGIRVELARASFRMLAADPVFGIGIGRFYPLSADAIRDPAVQAIYPQENAHNNYLQILTELGPAGLAAFLSLLPGFWRAMRQRAEPPWIGAGLGLLAFLITCLAGHPLLIPDVAIGFFAVLGAVTAALAAPGTDRPRRAPVVVLAAVLALLAASLPFRIRAETRGIDREGAAVTPGAEAES